ncbi:MAG: carboxy-S-adenosyl-L-methionine synthase CmoA [Bacteriovoracaceae bacterium]|nr:carboxy-S-adenosyl-L-methionine synthase CmoA [Bacteriovoracaceae bacterium]
MESKKDKIFDTELKKIKGFEFNSDVAEVFDDMLSRSIPFYDEIHRIILDLAGRLKLDNEIIYDIGCSTGTTISIVDKFLKNKKQKANFIGIDSSGPMLEKCRAKLKRKKITNTELICDSIENIKLQKSMFAVMNYTLQFIDTAKRPELLKKIYRSLKPGGVFVLSEKIKCTNHTVNDLLIDLYYDFKRRNGYSELEISQKREALENVLVPLTPERQIELLKKAGFKKVEVIFRWYNFACFIGIK